MANPLQGKPVVCGPIAHDPLPGLRAECEGVGILSGASTPVDSLPPSPASRSGRDHQRYGPDKERLVAGTVPYRLTSEAPCGIEVLLVSSSKAAADGRLQWILPKGGWEDDETEPQAAIRETYEEAGVQGRITRHICRCRVSGKHGKLLAHSYYGLLVDFVAKEWPEDHRMRQWVAIDKAPGILKHSHQGEACAQLWEVLQEEQA